MIKVKILKQKTALEQKIKTKKRNQSYNLDVGTVEEANKQPNFC